jgi:hypothetical protein
MNSNSSKLRLCLWSVWLFALVTIYPVPHTIALRNLLLLIGLLGLAWNWRTNVAELLALLRDLAWLATAGWVLCALTAWIVFQSSFIAPLPTVALDRVRADWLMALLLLAIGAMVALRAGKRGALRALVLSLFAHMLFVAVFQSWQWHLNGNWSVGIVPFAERDYHSTLNGLFIALLLADRLSLLLAGNAPLNFSAGTTWWLLTFALGIDVLLKVRNGTAVSIALVIVGVGILFSNSELRKRWGARLVMALGFVILLGVISARTDVRWQRFIESVAVGIESNSPYWMTSDPNQLPPTPSGKPLEESAYARAAWGRQALEAIAMRPLGIGFGHDAFGRAIEARYGHKGMGSSHSGWLDFALANGIPGLALLLALGTVVVVAAWRQFRARVDGYALMLALTVFGYWLRCLLDGHLSGWRFTLFALIVGVLVGSSARRQSGNRVTECEPG